VNESMPTLDELSQEELAQVFGGMRIDGAEADVACEYQVEPVAQ
jgi:hypothetical protein